MVESPLTVRPEYEPHAGKPRVFVHRGTRGAELWRTNPAGGSPIDVTDQLPFGDFTPGRYAWLLGDVKPTTERCPRCWGWGVIRAHPVVVLDDDVLVEGEACPVCDQAKVCAPVPMRGRRGLWAPNADDWSARRVDRAATADVPRTRRGPPPTLAMTPPITLSLELLARRIECRECGARPGAACIGARTRTLTLVHRERKLGVLRIIDDAIAVEGGSPP
jgi:hypothetical protein